MHATSSVLLYLIVLQTPPYMCRVFACEIDMSLTSYTIVSLYVSTLLIVVELYDLYEFYMIVSFNAFYLFIDLIQ